MEGWKLCVSRDIPHVPLQGTLVVCCKIQPERSLRGSIPLARHNGKLWEPHLHGIGGVGGCLVDYFKFNPSDWVALHKPK